MNKIKIALVIALLCATTAVFSQSIYWSPVGMVKFPDNRSDQPTGMGRVSQIVFHPTDSNIIFAVSGAGGLWKSTNLGATWKPVSDNFPQSRTSCMVINPKKPDIMYMGSGDPNQFFGGTGVYKTLNGGKNWVRVATGIGSLAINRMVIHPTDTNVLIATTNSGIYKTIDGGANWVRKSSSTAGFNHIDIKPHSKTGVIASSFNNVYYSNNFGETWTTVNLTSIPNEMSSVAIAVTPQDSNLVYAVAWRNTSSVGKTHFGGLFVSRNGGVSFTLQSSTPQILDYSANGSGDGGQGSWNLTMCVDPMDAGKVLVGAINLWSSADTGKTWTNLSYWGNGGAVHADQHDQKFSPYSRNIYFGNDGGVYVSRDSAKTFRHISDGLQATDFYTMEQSILNRDKLIGGTQDNGVQFFKDKTWFTTQGGDYSADFKFNPLDSNIATYQTEGKKLNMTEVRVNNNYNAPQQGLFAFSYQTANLVYNADRHLNRAFNGNATNPTWAHISDSATLYSASVRTASLTVCKANSNILYWGRTNSTLYRIDKASLTTPVFTALVKPASGEVKNIETYEKDSNYVAITIGGNIYVSYDKGTNWISHNKNLSNANTIVKIRVDDKSSDTSTYIITNSAVYFTKAGQNTWTNITANLPSISSIRDLDLYSDGTSKSCIRIAFYGRGVWSAPLMSKLNTKPVADFGIYRNTEAFCDHTYILNDMSMGGTYDRLWTIYPSNSFVYINGTDSLSAQPQIRLTGFGNIIITLKINNLYGKSESSKLIHKPNYTSSFTYCKPTTTNLNNNFGYGIRKVEFSGINNASYPKTFVNPNLEDFSCLSAAFVKPGGSTPGFITVGTSNTEAIAFFVDRNNDGDFADASERIDFYSATTGRRPINVFFPLTNYPKNQYLRMRIMSDASTPSSSGAGCNTLSYGGAEDYLLYIDSVRPKFNISIPKPVVTSCFKATVEVTEYAANFDSASVSFVNAKPTYFKKLTPYKFEYGLSPLKNGKIYVKVNAGVVSDIVGWTNLQAMDSTTHDLKINSFTFVGKSQKDSIFYTDSGGIIHTYLNAGVSPASLSPKFSLTDSAQLFEGSTLQVSEVTSNNFGSLVTYLLKSKDGCAIKKYYVTVYTNSALDTNCKLLTFDFQNPNKTGTVTQTSAGGTVSIKVPFGTNLNSRFALTTIDSFAKSYINNISDTSGVSKHNFSTSVVYKIVAQDTHYKKYYTVNVTVEPKKEAKILSWTLANPNASGTIVEQDSVTGTIKVKVPTGTNLSALVASFSLSDSCILKIGSTIQTSGSSNNNYSSAVVAKVINKDTSVFRNYTITVTVISELNYLDSIKMDAGEFTISSLCKPTSGDFPYLFTDAKNKLVFSLDPNGNDLGTVCWGVHIDSSNAKSRRVNMYEPSSGNNSTGILMDRNIFIHPQYQPGVDYTVSGGPNNSGKPNPQIRWYFSAKDLADIAMEAGHFATDSISLLTDSIRVTKYNPTLAGTENLSINDNFKKGAYSMPTQSWQRFGNDYVFNLEVSEFSEFYAGFVPGMAVLTPLEKFNIILVHTNTLNQKPTLKYTVSDEENIVSYELFRKRASANQWESVCIQNNLGNNTYTCNDPEILSENTYYLVVAKFNNSSTSQSPIILVHSSNGITKGLLTVSPVITPNPFNDKINISGLFEKSLLRIYQSDGKLAFEKSVENGEVVLPKLSSGSYLFVITYDGSAIYNKKLIHE